jgi:hypothetical protein
MWRILGASERKRGHPICADALVRLFLLMTEKCSAFAFHNKIFPGLLSILSSMVPQWRIKVRSAANRMEYRASPMAEFVH